MLVVIIVDLCDEAARDKAEEESNAVEDKSDGGLDARVRQVLLTVITRVVFVAVACFFLADARLVTAFFARLIIGISNFANLSCFHYCGLQRGNSRDLIEHRVAGWLCELQLRLGLIVNDSLVGALWPSVVSVQPNSFQVLALAVGDVEATNWLLHNLATILAVVRVCNDLWLLDQKLVEATLSKAATSEGDN